MPALERLYTIAPSFRAEQSRTRRHLTEFWHAEMEMAWATNADIMVHGEGVVRHIAKTMLDECEEELTSIDRDLELIARYADSPYPRMRYDEAVDILQSKGVEIEWGEDLDHSKESILTQDFDVPHFLTHYPKIAKPFYHRVDPDDEKYVLCHDLLAPEGYGEIIGGGERTWTEKEILERIDEEGTPRDPYQFYIDVRSYGGVPHGGFGLGVDRVVSWLAGATSIREVILPRTSDDLRLSQRIVSPHIGQGIPGMNAPSKNPQCGQMDIKSSTTMLCYESTRPSRFGKAESVTNEVKNDEEVLLLHHMMCKFSGPVVPGIEQDCAFTFAEHTDITHGITNRCGVGFLNTKTALQHLYDGSLSIHLHLVSSIITDASR